jgi:MFS family permease
VAPSERTGSSGRLRRRLQVLLPDGAAARALALASLIDATGSGLFIAGSALFFTRVVGFSITQVGLGLSVSGIAGFAATLPLGALADRVGRRRMLVVLYVLRGLGYVAYVFVTSFAGFLVLVALMGAADRAASPTLQALIGDAVPAQDRVRTNAYLRSVRNAGYTVGGLLGALALQIDTRQAYEALILGDGLSFLVAAALLVRLRRSTAAGPPSAHAAEEAMPERRLAALRDRRYLALTALVGVLWLNDSVLNVGLPLWVGFHTEAPRALVGILFAINTVLVVFFQVRLSRIADTGGGAARALHRAGIVLAAGALLFAVAGELGRDAAIAVLVAGILLHTLGEMLLSAGSWQLSLLLAPAAQRARYLAVFSLGQSGQRMIGPALVTAGVVDVGVPGWTALAAVFVGTGVVGQIVGRQALAHPVVVARMAAD